MTQVTATVIKTVTILYTEAPIIRCVAHKDIPSLDIKEGSVFYLARSSKNDGTYYVATWNYERIQWDCRCPSTKPCRHNRLITADCSKAHSLQGYAPESKSATFAALMRQYDYRNQPAKPASVIAEAEKIVEERIQHAKATGKIVERPVRGSLNRRGVTWINGIPM